MKFSVQKIVVILVLSGYTCFILYKSYDKNMYIIVTDAHSDKIANHYVKIEDETILVITPLLITNEQSVSPRSLITAHNVGVLNV
jgi:archaellum component FlaF (FlaF/FlaG flagellin family)